MLVMKQNNLEAATPDVILQAAITFMEFDAKRHINQHGGCGLNQVRVGPIGLCSRAELVALLQLEVLRIQSMKTRGVDGPT